MVISQNCGQDHLAAMIRVTAIIVAFQLTLLLPVTARADGSGACTFTGIVTVDNAEVADGTIITAIIADDEYNTHTSTVSGYSTYVVVVRAPDGKSYADGTKVIFKVSDRNTVQTATFKSGANIKLDLAASTTSTLSPANVAIVVGSVLILLALAAAAYYVLTRRRGIRIADWSGARGTVPSGQALAAAAEGQPINRYIWDNAKLAWVENTALGARQPSTKQSVSSSIRASAHVPANTYIWDIAKLDWVENTALGACQPSMKQSVTSSVRASARVPARGGSTRQMEQDTPVMLDSQKRAAVQERPVAMTGKEAVTNQTVAAIYVGNVKLLVTSPGGLGQLRKFSKDLSRLRHSHMIKARVVNVVSRQSLSFELFLLRPVPLVKILKALPEVDTVSDVSGHNLVEVRLKG